VCSAYPSLSSFGDWWRCNVSPLTATQLVLHHTKGRQAWMFYFGGEIVTSRCFHRKAVLSTLDQLGKTKTHTQGNLQKTRQTRPFSKMGFLFFPIHTDMATAAHVGYSNMHSRLCLHTSCTWVKPSSRAKHYCTTHVSQPAQHLLSQHAKQNPQGGNHKCPYRNPQHAY
jgi:hypothetical protein